MFREDILVACGFHKERLLEASDSTVDALKYMLELAFSQEDRKFALRYLARINCYLAARCCITPEDRELVLEQYPYSNCDSPESQSMAPYHRVLALYYLEQYDTAGNYIDLCFDRQSDAFKHNFYQQIVEIGFHRSKDQVYFLCHCYIGSYFFDTLLELVTTYNWKCPIDPQEQYYPDFVKMITALLKGKYYALLYKLLFVLGENLQQAKQIILATQGWESPTDMLDYLYLNKYQQHNSKAPHAKLSSRLYAQTQLALAFAEDGAKSVFYTKKVQNLQSLYKAHPVYQPAEKRDLARSLFLLCSQQCRTAESFLAFEAAQPNLLDARYLLPDDFLPTYLHHLIQILTVVLKSRNLQWLQQISFVNIFSTQFRNSAYDNERKLEVQQFLRREIFTDPFRKEAHLLLQNLKAKRPDLFSAFYKNTYLSLLFPYEQIDSVPAPIAQEADEPAQPERFTLTLSYGKTEPFSFRFHCDGDDYIGYRIPEGTYSIQWLSAGRSDMIEVYNGEAAEGMEVSPDEYPIRVCTLKTSILEVKPGQYITLSGGSQCVLTLTEE